MTTLIAGTANPRASLDDRILALPAVVPLAALDAKHRERYGYARLQIVPIAWRPSNNFDCCMIVPGFFVTKLFKLSSCYS